jgi:hypothetical protein
VTVLQHLENPAPYRPVSHSAGSEFETFMQRNVYRQPWAPAISSTLGISRPAVYHMAQSGAVKSDDTAPYAPRHEVSQW